MIYKIAYMNFQSSLYSGRRDAHLLHEAPVRSGLAQQSSRLGEFIFVNEVLPKQWNLAHYFYLYLIEITVISECMIVHENE